MIRTSVSLALLLCFACATDEVSESVDSSSTTSQVAEAEASASNPNKDNMSTTASGMYSLQTSTLDGTSTDLSQYAGQVTLVVNVASECGYTRQYSGLQELQEEFAERGFTVLAFPSNEFGGQEPGSPEQIREFCSSRYGVTFPLFEKCEVKPGSSQSPVYGFLQEQTGEVPGWNFCKYLVARDGSVVKFYKSGVAPESAELRKAIEAALG